MRKMVTCSKTQQQAISRTAASCVKSHVTKSTESEVVSGPLGQPVIIEQISSLIQASQAALQASQAALKAGLQASQAALKADLQADLQAITSRLDTMQSSLTTIQTGLKDLQNELKILHQNKATELNPDQFDTNSHAVR